MIQADGVFPLSSVNVREMIELQAGSCVRANGIAAGVSSTNTICVYEAGGGLDQARVKTWQSMSIVIWNVV